MFKNIMLIVLCFVMFFSISGCSPHMTLHISDISNKGELAVEQEGWIYYISNNNWNLQTGDNEEFAFVEGALYKINTDGSQETKLTDDYASDLTVAGDWIYYLCGGHDHDMYKIKTDGSHRTKLFSKVYVYSILGDWIYFESDEIYKMKTDLSNFTKIDNNNTYYKMKTDSSNFTPIDKYEYCEVIATDNNNTYYKMANVLYKLEPSGQIKEICDVNFNAVDIKDNWIYYVHDKNNNEIVRMKIDCSYKSNITVGDKRDTNIYAIKVYGKDIYYINDITSEISKIGIDGSDNKLINSIRSHYSETINLAGNWIYYKVDSGKRSEKIYDEYNIVRVRRMKLDGSDDELVQPVLDVKKK